MRSKIRSILTAALLLSLCGCHREPEAEVVWLAHATDPHLFEEASRSAPARQGLQESLNQKAFSRLLSTIRDWPDARTRPRYLLLTGDLGIGEEGGDRAAQLETLTEMLSAARGLTVYFVAGNNDIAGESAQTGDLATAHRFIDELSSRVQSSAVDLVDLTACFRDRTPIAGGCSADVAGTDLRLIGFPSYSFKTKSPARSAPEPEAETSAGTSAATTAAATAEPGAASEPATTNPPAEQTPGSAPAQPTAGAAAAPTRDEIHLARMQVLSSLVTKASAEGKRVLIATHIPELNDPWIQAQEEFTGSLRYDPARLGRPPWSAWDLPREAFDQWREIVSSPTVVGVLAGHFHDSHREVYERSDWERERPGSPVFARAPRSKILVAPPLAVRLQDTSPIQARGFELLGLADGRVESRRLYWYDAAGDRFAPGEAVSDEPGREDEAEISVPAALRWLWDLETGASPSQRAAIVAIALLVAFLTVVAIWRIPPADSELTSAAATATEAEEKTGPFDNNFTRAILGGLSGMVGVAVLDDNLLSYKTFYIVWFVAGFVVLLVASSLLHALAETVRARLAAGLDPSRALPWSQREQAVPIYLWRRFWRWAFSWRAALLVFLDTFFNYVTGRNQLETAVLGETILDLQKSLVASVDQIAEELHRAIATALAKQGEMLERKDCRVNVSALSDDGTMLSYVSLSKGSLLRPFGRKSIAWITATTGRALWWKEGYVPDQVVVLDNRQETLAGFDPAEIKLKDVFEPRGRQDYGGFLVLPLPWYSRGGEYRRGALHISFKQKKHLELLWPNLDVNGIPAYGSWDRLVEECVEKESERPRPAEAAAQLVEPAEGPAPKEPPEPKQPASSPAPCCADPRVVAALRQALGVLPEVLRGFNPVLFESLIKPR